MQRQLLSSIRECGLFQFLVTVSGRIAQFFLDTDQLVVLGNAIRTAHGTSLDLSRVGSHCDVGDGGILRFTLAVRSNRRITVPMSHFDGIQRLCQRSDLVHFDEDGIAGAHFDAFL